MSMFDKPTDKQRGIMHDERVYKFGVMVRVPITPTHNYMTEDYNNFGAEFAGIDEDDAIKSQGGNA